MTRTTLSNEDAASDDVDEPVAGDVLGGRYRVVRRIAQGGMAVVYEADDMLVSERIAVKTMRPELARDPNALARFRRELQLARKVTHPNVCRTFDVVVDGSRVLLTMELLRGESLASLIEKRGKFTPSDALPIIEQLAAALDAAHAAGIVHRDFKSQNVIVEPEGRVVVTDFGIARSFAGDASTTVTSDGGLVGTPAYMAPEQVEGRTLTKAADIYALGVVMFEMMTGKLPFEGPTPLAVAAARVKTEPPIARDVPPHWADAIGKCMALDPERRFAHARDVVAALRTKRRSRVWLAAPIILAGAGLFAITTRHATTKITPVHGSVALVELDGDPRTSELLGAVLGLPVLAAPDAVAEFRVVGSDQHVKLVDAKNQIVVEASGNVDAIATKLRPYLGPRRAVRAALPATADVAYAEARHAFRHHAIAETKAALARAHETAPSDPLVAWSEADLLATAGEATAALAAYRRAFELAAQLPEEQRNTLEIQLRMLDGSTERALELARALSTAHPDDAWYAAQLVSALAATGKTADAFAAAETLRATAGDHPSIALAEAALAGAIVDYHRQKAAATRASERALAFNATSLVADAQTAIATASAGLADYQTALDALRLARSVHITNGNITAAAAVGANEVALLWSLGKIGDAHDVADRVVTIAAIPELTATHAWALELRASVEYAAANFTGAETTCREATQRAAGAEAATLVAAYCDTWIGAGHRLRGDPDTITTLDAAITTLTAANDQLALPIARIERGLAKLERGDQTGAGADFDAVVSTSPITAASLALAKAELAFAADNERLALSAARTAEQMQVAAKLPAATAHIALRDAASLTTEVLAIESPDTRLRAIAVLARAGVTVDVKAAIKEAHALGLLPTELVLRAAAGENVSALARARGLTGLRLK